MAEYLDGIDLFRAVTDARAAHRRGLELNAAVRASALLHGYSFSLVYRLTSNAERGCQLARAMLEDGYEERTTAGRPRKAE